MARTLGFAFLIAGICCYPNWALQSNTQNAPSLTGPMTTFDPAHQKPLVYSDDALTITLVAGKEQNLLRILTRSNSKESLVNLPNEMAQVDEIRKGVNDKFVIRGMVNGSGSEIVVIDAQSAKIIDKFLCYGPAISNDGRYIAFIKFYPMHFAEGTEDHYMLYDLSKSSQENRPTEIRSDDWETVGVCLYPIGIGNHDFDNLRRSEGTQHESKSLFFWNPVKPEFLVADQIASSRQITLILASINENGEATVKTAEQPSEELCSSESIGGRSCSLLMRKVDFGQEGEQGITAIFEIVVTKQLKTVRYDLSRFQPAK